MTLRRIVSLASVLGVASVARAQGTPPFTARPLLTLGVTSFTYQSPSMGVTYDVSVWVPPGFDAKSGKKLPLLVITDGNVAFTPALDATRGLVSAQAIPEMMIASIGSPPEDGELANTRRRIYEFSPPDWARTDVFGRQVEGACQQIQSAPGRCTGGAKLFLRAINTELLPGLVQRFPVDTTQLGLFGVSAGGFFASFVIFQPESRFTKYIISSPAMAYGDDLIHRMEADYARANKDLKAGIWLSSGSLEMNDPMLEAIGHIVSGHIRLGAALTSRKYPGLRLASHILEGLGHSDGAGTALARGLRFLYGNGAGDNYELKK